MITRIISTTIILFCVSATILISVKSKASATDQHAGNALNLTITNVKNENGMVVIAIYDKANEFKNNSSNVHSLLSLRATKPVLTLSVHNFPAGKYAISVMHDTNNNQALDFNKSQQPIEAYAYSNNVGKFSIPSFKDAEFKHQGVSNLKLKLIQPN